MRTIDWKCNKCSLRVRFHTKNLWRIGLEKLTIASIDLLIRERNTCHLIDSFVGNKIYFYLRKENRTRVLFEQWILINNLTCRTALMATQDIHRVSLLIPIFKIKLYLSIYRNQIFPSQKFLLPSIFYHKNYFL